MMLASSFFPRDESSWMLPFMDVLQEEKNNLPSVWPRNSSDCCFHTIWLGFFACLLYRSSIVSTGLCPHQACWPLKLYTLSPSGCKKWQNLAPLIFHSNGLGKMFSLYVLLCAPPSLSPPSLWPWLSPHKCQPRSISLPDHISTLPTFFDVTSSLPLVVEFVLPVFRSISGVFRMIWWLSNCIHGRRQA